MPDPVKAYHRNQPTKTLPMHPSMIKWLDVPKWLPLVILLCCFAIGQSFVVPYWNHNSRDHDFHCEGHQHSWIGINRPVDQSLGRLYALSTKRATDFSTVNAKQENVNRFYWDFQGFPCYAEIARPSTEGKGWLPSLTVTNNSNNSAKPHVILVHGFGCSTVYWRETRSYLTNAGYVVHSVDLLGQGNSAKPGRAPPDEVYYSIDLWARMVDEYARRYVGTTVGDNEGVVLVGNSLGSVVALSAATGDCYDVDGDKFKDQESFLASKVRGLCFFNIGVGMNSRNVVKLISPEWLKSVVTVIFNTLDKLVFDNSSLLTYVIENQLSKATLRNALLNLYACADDPERKVDDELVDSFLNPVLKDPTPAVVEVIRQIYTNDAGKTPMEFHDKYFVSKADDDKSKGRPSPSPMPMFGIGGGNAVVAQTEKRSLPIHLVWGDKDNVTPLSGPVGQFYSKLATSPSNVDSGVDVSMEVIRAGHIPFDERPECNMSFLNWLERLDLSRIEKYQDQTSVGSPSMGWPFKF